MISLTKLYVSVVLIMLTCVSVGMAIALPEKLCINVCHDTFERNVPLTHWCFPRRAAGNRAYVVNKMTEVYS